MTTTHRGLDLDLIRRIEHAMARNLEDYVAAYRSAVPQAGAQHVAVAGGVAAFTGIGSPLTTVKGTRGDLAPGDLDEIESFFGDHSAVAVTIEMAPWLTEESKQLLDERGYRVVGQEDVVATVSGSAPPGGARRGNELRAEAIPAHAFPELMRRSYELADEPLWNGLATAAANLPNARLYGVCEDHRWIACAESVTYGDVVMFGCDGTLPAARGSGAQAALIEARLDAVPAGALVIAEVAPGSGSGRNYARSGFHIAFTRTHHVRALT